MRYGQVAVNADFHLECAPGALRGHGVITSRHGTFVSLAQALSGSASFYPLN